MATLEELADRVERLLLRHDELKRTAALLEQQLAAVTHERDSMRARLSAARSRIDALLERLPQGAGVEERTERAVKQIEVTIMGQSYILGCPEGGESSLLEAVDTVDQEMSAIRDDWPGQGARTHRGTGGAEPCISLSRNDPAAVRVAARERRIGSRQRRHRCADPPRRRSARRRRTIALKIISTFMPRQMSRA